MAKGGQQQVSGQSSMDVLYISAFFVLLAAGLWYTQHPIIVKWFYWLKSKETDLVLWFFNAVEPFLSDFDISVPDLQALTVAQGEMLSSVPAEVSLKEMWKNGQVVGFYLAFPSIILAVLMVVYLGFFSLKSRFNTIFSMKTLRETDREHWLHYNPVAKINLIDVDLDKQPWAVAQRPMDFCEKHKLLNHFTKDGRPAVEVNVQLAKRYFSLQMGPLWSGLDSLPPHAQALFAIFAAKAEKDGQSANKLLRQISASAYSGTKLDFSGTRELLLKHVRTSQVVGRAVGPHAYVLTVMASMLEAARTDGVIAAAEFLWLKRIDRSLWYMLNSIGRQTPFCEAAGAYAHWIVEKRLRRPLKVPMVDMAVDALKEAIADIKYNPDGY